MTKIIRYTPLCSGQLRFLGLSATLGPRHTKDNKKYRPTHVTQGVAPIILLLDAESVDFSDTSPRFSLDYRWNENLFTYFSYSAGFKSGGFTGRTVDPWDGARPFDPEEAETYEIGVKLDFDRVRINAAVFANTPENTFNFSADYFIDLKGGNELLLRLDYAWKDEHFNDAENTPLLAQDAFGLLNLSAALTLQERWHFSAGIKNVTDEIYLFSGFSQPGVGFIEGSYSRGREYYLTTEYRF